MRKNLAFWRHVYKAHALLIAAGIRVKLDERDGLTPGFKFNDWEYARRATEN